MKSEYRKKKLEQRKKLTSTDIKEKSRKIIENLYNIPELGASKTIMFYIPVNNEVDVIEFMKELIDVKRLVLPCSQNGNLFAAELTSFSELEEGSFCVPEPKSKERINPEEIDIVFVPGIVFDKNGNRIGYGKGYFDKFLKNTNALKVGLAYDFQIIECIETDEWDVPMDLVITELGVIRIA